jgi:hypothetical protein
VTSVDIVPSQVESFQVTNVSALGPFYDSTSLLGSWLKSHFTQHGVKRVMYCPSEYRLLVGTMPLLWKTTGLSAFSRRSGGFSSYPALQFSNSYTSAVLRFVNCAVNQTHIHGSLKHDHAAAAMLVLSCRHLDLEISHDQ